MSTRLELVWPNKDKFLLVPRDDAGKPVWVESTHPAASEVRLSTFTDAVGPANEANPYADNLMFIGDSLDALRILAEVPEFRREYRGKVKLVYIDPPFNTGETFTHYDDWMEHSTWLSFMRDRLLLIKELLAPDGSAWVHLDDKELHRMRSLMDEVFGPDNFVASVVWQKSDSTRNDAKGLSIDHDTILVYRRSSSWQLNRLPRTAQSNARFKSPDGDPDPWFDDNPTAPGARTHQGMVYAIQHPITGELVYPARGRCWWTEQPRILAEMSQYADYELRDIDDAVKRAELCGISEGDVRQGVKAVMVKGSMESAAERARERYNAGTWPLIILRSGGEGGLGRKSYVPDVGLVPGTIWLNDTVGHNREAKAEAKALFPEATAFSTPKPERLLQRVIQIATDEGDIVLDCFGGSGTTAAVAHKMKRRWVTCEVLASTVEAYTRPRLTKVVDGTDQGGVSVPPSSVAPVEELPDGVAPRDVKAAASTLKALADAELLDGAEMETLQQALRQLAKTKKLPTKEAWSGGGAFRVVEVGPTMYETLDSGLVLLADWATNGKFSRAVAGQLGFEYEDAAPFCGRRGRMRLAVLDGAVGPEEVRDLVSRLEDKERLTIVAKVVLPETEDTLAKLSPGSRVRKAPRDLLTPPRRRRTANTDGSST